MPDDISPPAADTGSAEPNSNGAAKPITAAELLPRHEQLPPFLRSAEVLLVSPLHAEVTAELRWAYVEGERGAFNAYLGQYLGIVNKTVLAVGDSMYARNEAARKAGVPPERVALFYVGGEEN
jgi:hypothetical protein